MINAAKSNPARFQERLRDLLRLLTEMLRLHESLMAVTHRKLIAMRQCHIQGMQECVRQEAELTTTIRQREVQRRRLMAAIGADLGLGRTESQAMSINQLAIRLDERKGLKLRAMAKQLAAVLTEISKINAAVTMFAREMLDHYRSVFSEITKGFAAAPVYVPGGRRSFDVSAQVLDTTG